MTRLKYVAYCKECRKGVRYNITIIGMVYMSKRQQPHWDVSPRPPIGLQWRPGNPHTTGQAAAGPERSLYTGTAKVI